MVRPERAGDEPAIRRVHCSAFPTEAEAQLVDALRQAGKLVVSLVAELDGEIVGHIAFSPIRVVGTAVPTDGLGLAPLAVVPAQQRRGIGFQLTKAGITAARGRRCPFVVVLGDPDFYRRFGFQRASLFDLANEYGADEAFRVLDLHGSGLPVGGGLVKYASEFAALADEAG